MSEDKRLASRSGATEPKVLRLTADFLKKRGLSRDKANYVMAVIRMRHEVRHLMETAHDPDVVQELLCLDAFFDDSIGTMYEIERDEKGPTPNKPKGAA